MNGALYGALKWYGEQAQACHKVGRVGDAPRKMLDADQGRRALAALAQVDDHTTGGAETSPLMTIASAQLCIRNLAELLSIMDGRTFIPGTIEREIVLRSKEVIAELLALVQRDASAPAPQSITPPEGAGELERVAKNDAAIVTGLAKQVAQLRRRVEGLERDSHPPLDPTPAVLELLASFGFTPIATLSTPEVVDGPSGVWSKAVYAAADKARNDALAIDPNDQMSALAVAVDAALACEASDAKGLVEALEKIAEGRSVLFSHSSHPKQPLRDKEAQRIARTALSQHRGVS